MGRVLKVDRADEYNRGTTRTWLSGRARPCQGRGRGFESRRPLESRNGIPVRFFFVAVWPSG